MPGGFEHRIIMPEQKIVLKLTAMMFFSSDLRTATNGEGISKVKNNL